MIDLERIKQAIATAPDGGTAATVTKEFLQQVVEEVSAGRLAQARLRQHDAMGQVLGTLGKGAPA